MKITVREMVLTALFTASMVIGAFIKIPFYPVDFTLQVLFCMLAGVILGSKLGALSQLLYVFIGLIGIPVFSKGGGPSYIFQPGFGYLIGFIFAAFVIGLITEKSKKYNFINILIASFVGLIALYLIGVPYLLMILNFYMGTSYDFITSAIGKGGFLYYMSVDIVKILIISVVSPTIIKRVNNIN